MGAASGKGCPSRRPLARGILGPLSTPLPPLPPLPRDARWGCARWPGSIRFLTLPEPDSWVYDLGEERLWTWCCVGGGGGVLGSDGFRPPNSARSGAQAPSCEINFSKHCLKPSYRLFTYLECCGELGFRFFVYGSDREWYSLGGGRRRKDYSLKKCITQARSYRMKQGP